MGDAYFRLNNIHPPFTFYSHIHSSYCVAVRTIVHRSKFLACVGKKSDCIPVKNNYNTSVFATLPGWVTCFSTNIWQHGTVPPPCSRKHSGPYSAAKMSLALWSASTTTLNKTCSRSAAAQRIDFIGDVAKWRHNTQHCQEPLFFLCLFIFPWILRKAGN